MPSGKMLAWIAGVALVVAVAHDRFMAARGAKR
jgi:hypothetical protein